MLWSAGTLLRSTGMAKQIKVDVMGDIRMARANGGALSVGGLLGGAVPAATFWVSHFEYDAQHPFSVSLLMILGGLLFSAKTVMAWAATAFNDKGKAAGFVVLTELLMVTTQHLWVAAIALAYLVCINAVATGCTLARQDVTKRKAAKKAREAQLPMVGEPANGNSGITRIKRSRRKVAA